MKERSDNIIFQFQLILNFHITDIKMSMSLFCLIRKRWSCKLKICMRHSSNREWRTKNNGKTKYFDDLQNCWNGEVSLFKKHLQNHCHLIIENVKDGAKSHLTIDGEWFAAFILNGHIVSLLWKNIYLKIIKRHIFTTKLKLATDPVYDFKFIGLECNLTTLGSL